MIQPTEARFYASEILAYTDALNLVYHIHALLQVTAFRTPFDFCVPTISVTTEFMPCQDSEGNDNHILIIHVPASPRLHANQADEVF